MTASFIAGLIGGFVLGVAAAWLFALWLLRGLKTGRPWLNW